MALGALGSVGGFGGGESPDAYASDVDVVAAWTQETLGWQRSEIQEALDLLKRVMELPAEEEVARHAVRPAQGFLKALEALQTNTGSREHEALMDLVDSLEPICALIATAMGKEDSGQTASLDKLLPVVLSKVSRKYLESSPWSIWSEVAGARRLPRHVAISDELKARVEPSISPTEKEILQRGQVYFSERARNARMHRDLIVTPRERAECIEAVLTTILLATRENKTAIVQGLIRLHWRPVLEDLGRRREDRLWVPLTFRKEDGSSLRGEQELFDHLRSGGSGVVMGPTGSGKTRLALQLETRLAEAASRNPGIPIPLRIDCRTASRVGVSGGIDNFDEMVSGIEPAKGHLLRAAQSCRQLQFVFLVDGLEVLGEQERRYAVAAIAQFVRKGRAANASYLLLLRDSTDLTPNDLLGDVAAETKRWSIVGIDRAGQEEYWKKAKVRKPLGSWRPAPPPESGRPSEPTLALWLELEADMADRITLCPEGADRIACWLKAILYRTERRPSGVLDRDANILAHLLALAMFGLGVEAEEMEEVRLVYPWDEAIDVVRRTYRKALPRFGDAGEEQVLVEWVVRTALRLGLLEQEGEDLLRFRSEIFLNYFGDPERRDAEVNEIESLGTGFDNGVAAMSRAIAVRSESRSPSRTTAAT